MNLVVSWVIELQGGGKADGENRIRKIQDNDLVGYESFLTLSLKQCTITHTHTPQTKKAA